MILKRTVFLFFISFLFVPGTIFASGSLNETFKAIDEEILTHFSAYENLKKATEAIGHRMTATENGRKAEEMVADYFKQYGYTEVEFQSFEINSWVRGDAELLVRDGPGAAQSIAAKAFAYSAYTAEVEGPVIYLEGGALEDLTRAARFLKDRIVLIDLNIRDSSKRNTGGSKKIEFLIKHGAKGAVFISSRADDAFLAGSASLKAEPVSMPVLCITRSEGERFVKKIKENKNPIYASIKTANSGEKSSARNVIATLSGNGLPGEMIVIGAHLDSWDLASGAMDNGTGVFTVLEIARVFKVLKLAPKRTVQFVLYMGEEEGMVGSRAFVLRLKDTNRLKEVRYAINLDMNGDPLGFDLMGRNQMISFVNQTGALIRERDVNFKNKTVSTSGLNGDQESFMLEGVPVMLMNGDFDPNMVKYYHTDKDTFEKVDRAALLNNCRFAAMMLYALADAPELPVKTQSSEETREFLTKLGAKDELVSRERWKWGR